MLRLNAGFAKGMTLKTPEFGENQGIRPTAARVREAIWNILQVEVQGALIADLCAGSGAVGIEGLARGARQCVFVEKDPKVHRILRENVAAAEARAAKNAVQIEPSLVLLGDGLGADPVVWQKIVAKGPFDIIWVDPPYAVVAEALSGLLEQTAQLCGSGGVLVLESNDDLSVNVHQIPTGWDLEKVKAYGATKLHLWRRT